MLLVQSPEYKYQTQVLKLPFKEKGTLKGTFIGLILKDTNQAIDILNNPKIKRDIKFSRYYKPYLFRDRMFTYNVRYKMTSSEATDLASFCKTLNLTFYNRPLAIKDKNILVDTSLINTYYFDHTKGRAYKLIAEQYIAHLANYLNTYCKFPHDNRFLMINLSDWGISGDNKAQQLSAANRFLNPISILYFLLKKKYRDAIQPLAGYKLIVLDGKNGWFWFDLGTLNEESFMAFHKVFMKVKNHDIIVQEILDDQVVEIEEKKPRAIIDKSELEDNKSVSSDEDDEPEDLPEEIADDEPIKEIESDESAEEQEEKLLKAAEEIENHHNEINRSMASNRRDAELRERQKKIKVNNITMSDLEDRKTANYHIEEVTLKDKIFGPTKNAKTVRFDNFNKSYNENLMDRDIMNVFRSLNEKRHPVYVRDIKVEDTSDAMNLKKTYHVTLEGEDRVRHSLTIDIPIPYDNNYFVIGGNRKQINNQQFPKPVIKLAPDTVQICSNYMKIFMYRYGDLLSPKVTIFKKIILNNPKLFKIKRGNACALNTGKKSSIEIDSLAKEFLSIEIRGTGVSLEFVQDFFNDKNLTALKDDYVYVIWNPNEKGDLRAVPVNVEKDKDGIDPDETFSVDEYKKRPIEEVGNDSSVIDLFAYTFKQVTGKEFWGLAGPHDKAGKRFMFTRCKISSRFIPTAILLSYYEGISTVLRKAGIQYRFTDKNPMIPQHADEGKIQFADGYLVYNRSMAKHALLMNGFSLVDTRNYNFSDFDQKDVYLDIFDALYDTRQLSRYLDGFYDNMIDPITKEILEDLDYPTDFVSLMIFANDLLADNEFTSELDMSKYRIRCMEQVPALLYKIVADAYSEYEATAMNKTPVKISVPKNELIKRIAMANNVEDYSTINPITEKEKLHNISSKGPTGVNLERAYTMEKRCFDKSMTGMIGISTSPDANCGVQRELTVEPKIMNSRGYIDVTKTENEMTDINLFTYAEQISPICIVRDDAIRSSMLTKQSKHLVPVEDMSPTLISNGIEKTLPYTISKDFAVHAKDNGKVVEMNEKTNLMIVAYDDGSNEAINLAPVTVKNSGGGFYLSNKMSAKFKPGQKFKKMDILAANDIFFSSHYDGTKFNVGTLCKVACMSNFGTYEDAKLITTSLSKRMAVEMIMKKHVILGQNATVSSIMKEGDKVRVGDELIRYEQSNSEEAVNKLLKNIGEDLKEDIKQFGKNSLRSKYDGEIAEVRIYSTFELDELSPSLRKVVGDYWKNINAKKALIKKYHITNPDDMGATFHEMAGPIRPDEKDRVAGYKIEQGGVIIEFYIKFRDEVGVGDKLADYGPLKGVTAAVIPPGEEPYTTWRPEEEISTIFPASSVLARLVPGILVTMLGNKLLIELKRKLQEIYEAN